MNIDDLSPELKEKILGCKTPDELIALAQEEGYTLSDEELEAISGGATCTWQSPFVWDCDDYVREHCPGDDC